MSIDSATDSKERLIPENKSRPRALPLALSLYRTDLLFRGLVDFALVGIVILAFHHAPSISSQVSDVLRLAANSIPGSKLDAQRNKFSRTGAAPGLATQNAAGETVRIQKSVIESAPPDVAAALKKARGHQDQRNFKKALASLKGFDETDPVIAYAKAAIYLQFGLSYELPKTQKLLRTATDAVIEQAYTLSGLAAVKQIIFYRHGRIPANGLKTLDGSGNTIKVSLDDLAAEAKLWFERGASLRQVDAIRWLAYSEFVGYGGKKNLSAAIAHWRDAANMGDAVSQFELGWLYLRGAGVQADADKAIALMQQAADQDYGMGHYGLATALFPKSLAGDADAAKKAIASLEKAITAERPKDVRSMSEHMLGRYLMKGAPPALRDPVKAIGHYRAALNLGNIYASFDLSEAYESGSGVKRSLVNAHKMLLTLNPPMRARIASEFKRLEGKMTPEELQLARANVRALEKAESKLLNSPFRQLLTHRLNSLHRKRAGN